MSLEARITDEVKRLTEYSAFEVWKKAESPKPGGLILINNSFVFREVDTNKAEEYVALRVGAGGDVEFPPVITSGLRLNADFKYAPSSSSLPPTRSLHAAVADGVKQLGELLFVLIGEIDDSTVLSEPVNHGDFDEIVWNPKQKQSVRVNARRIEVGQVSDEDAVWLGVEKHYRDSGETVPGGLREAVGVALDKLQERAVAKLVIRESGKSPEHGITDQIVTVLTEQMTQYDAALRRVARRPDDTTAQNEILRLAYNFASDATGYVNLIVSVCDLKPIVLWGTLTHHVVLSEAFRRLPWTRSRNKPSMKNYIDTISDARNSAFHNLFPFRKSLSLQLSGRALTGAELTIFSEHGRRKENVLSYRDKPLVDVLTGFTRARERLLTMRFWQQNREVMAATIALFDATSRFVKELHAAR